MDRTQRSRVIAAGMIGNVLEWYDFAIYGYRDGPPMPQPRSKIRSLPSSASSPASSTIAARPRECSSSTGSRSSGVRRSMSLPGPFAR